MVASRKRTYYNRKQKKCEEGDRWIPFPILKSEEAFRKYKEDAIPHSLIEEVVETARFAPSWKNTQIVRYVCVEDPVLKQQIADYCTMGFAHNEDIISRAPSLMVLTYISGRSGYERDGSFSTTRGDAWESFDAGYCSRSFLSGSL